MKQVLLGYAKLTRPANLPTAAADILAGVALAGAIPAEFSAGGFEILALKTILLLVAASVCLYAGGVVLNDVFDATLDAEERPERPIPSGLVPKKNAAVLGIALLLVGVAFALFCNKLAGVIAATLAMMIVLYNGFSKSHSFLGPLNMGICRGLNLFLGTAVFANYTHWEYAGIPLIYIFAITLISRGEVHGKNKGHLIWAGVLYALVIFAVLYILVTKTEGIWSCIPFLLLFAIVVYSSLIRAYRANTPANIKKAVISGVMALVILDASLAATSAPWAYALVILSLLPLSMVLSKAFAVT